VGVSASMLSTNASGGQTDLFTDQKKLEKMDNLTRQLDKLRSKYGSGIVLPATMLADPELTAFEFGYKFNPFGIRSGEEK